MRSRLSWNQSGQTLIWVALGLTALLAAVALAIDVGHVYSERRRMQNAADAGALAGAWEICFGDPAQALTTAEAYATDRNGAETAVASYPNGDTWRVNVVASESVKTFVAGVIGVTAMGVPAEAEAACSGARNLCGVWPITFRKERWDDMPQCPENDNVPFVVWNDAAFEETEPKYTDPITGKEYYLCDVCGCEDIPEFGPTDERYFLIGPGDRGWVNLPRPEPPYEELECMDNCGSIQSVCVINSDGGYTGLISLPTGEDDYLCLPGQPGVATNILHAIEANLNEEINILIWDRECGGGELNTGTCSGSPAYHIVQTGCAVATDVLAVNLYVKPEFADISGSASWCPKNVKAVLMEKRCTCESVCGSTLGNEPPQPGEVKAVSLTK